MKHIDPVCRMIVKEDSAKGTFEYNGKTYYFCSTYCVEEFKKEPDRYLKEGTSHKMMKNQSK